MGYIALSFASRSGYCSEKSSIFKENDRRFKAIMILCVAMLFSCISISVTEMESADQKWLTKAKKKAEFVFACDNVKVSAFEYVPEPDPFSRSDRKKVISLIAVEGCGKRSMFRLLKTQHLTPCNVGVDYLDVERAACDIYQDSSTLSDEKKK